MRLLKLLEKNRTLCKSSVRDVRCMAKYPLYLYGAGNLGKKLGHALQAAGIPFIGYIDKRAAQLRANGLHHAYTLDEVAQKQRADSVVILSALFSSETEPIIRRDLQRAGFAKIYALRELDWKSFPSAEFRSNIFIGHYDVEKLSEDEPYILRAYDLFHEETEQRFFLTQIEAYRSLDWSIFPSPLPLRLQYTAHDVPEQLNMDTFFDGGAFDGDTLRALHQASMPLKTYVAFEPQIELFPKIHASAMAAGVDCIAYPAGLSSKTQRLHFDNTDEGKSAAHVIRDNSVEYSHTRNTGGGYSVHVSL